MILDTLTDIIEGLNKRHFSSVELTQHYLQQIKHYHSLNAFISLDEEHALLEAKKADDALKNNKAHPLTGIPIAHKDIFCTTRLPTTCGSKMLETYVSPYEASIVNKLRMAGAITLGKTNMDEFAMGSSNESSYFGAASNPWNEKHVPGGSSGGSAAAVARGLVAFATGSDTGGSIRQPAAFCGISGIKPTYGLVSRFGMVAYASSLDQAGPMAHSCADLALILSIMAGHDPKDSTSVNQAVPKYTNDLTDSLSPLRIGLPKCFFHPDLDPSIQSALNEAIALLKKQGAHFVDIDLSLHSLWIPCYYVIACAEASSNLSRYDGLRFGHSSSAKASISELIKSSRSEGFGAEVQRRILTGTHVLSAGFYDAYYLQALKIRRLIQTELHHALKNVDIILGPTTPSTAFQKEQHQSPVQRYLADIFTVAANLAGLPALSIPIGCDKQGLPIGMQLMGSPFTESRLLNVGHQFQRNSHWHLAKPPIT